MSELVFRMIKDFLRQHFENIEVILADVHIFGGGTTNIIDEMFPSSIPLIFNYLNENAIAFR